MTSADLTREQAERLRLQVARILRWHNALVARMTRLGFATDDPVWLAGIRARDCLQDLHVAAHYASCEHGVGRADRS